MQICHFMKTLYRAKNPEHYAYIKDRVRRSNERRSVIARGHWSAAIAGGITDPLFLTTFIPGLNAIGLGRTVLVLLAALLRLALVMALLVRHVVRRLLLLMKSMKLAMNIASSTAISGFLGGAFKGASYLRPFIESSAKKLVGWPVEKRSSTYGENGTNLDDGYVGQSGGDYDAVVGNPLGSPSQRALSDPSLPQEVKKAFVDLAYNSSVPLQGNRGSMATQSVAQLSLPYEGQARAIEMAMRDFHAQHPGVGIKAGSL